MTFSKLAEITKDMDLISMKISQTTYTVAIVLNNIFSDFLEDGNLTWLEKQLLKKEISETIIDLEYASEISTLYSLRMKSLIQQDANN